MGNKTSTEEVPTSSAPEKLGAGLLLICEGQVLLLKRSLTSGNPGTWGLPGGNADPEDNNDLLTTAKREAQEELGTVPSFTVIDQVLTKRGKKGLKHYTVFLCALTPEDKARWGPTINMNEEHSAFRWMSLSEVQTNSILHPVVKLVFDAPHNAVTLKAISSSLQTAAAN